MYCALRISNKLNCLFKSREIPRKTLRHRKAVIENLLFRRSNSVPWGNSQAQKSALIDTNPVLSSMSLLIPPKGRPFRLHFLQHHSTCSGAPYQSESSSRFNLISLPELVDLARPFDSSARSSCLLIPRSRAKSPSGTWPDVLSLFADSFGSAITS